MIDPLQQIEAAWEFIANAYDIEPREFFEREAPTNGFKHPLVMAIHYIWKRDPKIVAALAASDQARQELERNTRERVQLHIEEVVLARRERDRRHGLQLKAEAEVSRLTAALAQTREALATLVHKVHGDPRYEAVWVSYHVHGGRYSEPTYSAELDAARAALTTDAHEHKLDCDEYHRHVAPRCCALDCWCRVARQDWAPLTPELLRQLAKEVRTFKDEPDIWQFRPDILAIRLEEAATALEQR